MELIMREPGYGVVIWEDLGGKRHEAPATSDLLGEALYATRRSRSGSRYPRQRNYHGLYFMEATGEHVWFESLLEESRLATLDMLGDVTAVASQPMELRFADGSKHFPDLIALHSDGRQTVFDVKPARKVDDNLTVFAKTQALCRRVGWGYEVLSEADPIVKRNVQYLRLFKHPGYRPPTTSTGRLDALAWPATFADVAPALCPEDLPQGRAWTLHLLWSGSLRTDLNLLLSQTSLLERGAS